MFQVLKVMGLYQSKDHEVTIDCKYFWVGVPVLDKRSQLSQREQIASLLLRSTILFRLSNQTGNFHFIFRMMEQSWGINMGQYLNKISSLGKRIKYFSFIVFLELSEIEEIEANAAVLH